MNIPRDGVPALPPTSAARSLKAALQDELRELGSYARIGAVLDAFLPMALANETAGWFEVLGREWTGFDNVGSNTQELADIFEQVEWPVMQMMTDAEREMYLALPDVVTVYRGCGKNNKYGLSWTLDEQVARTFPNMPRYWQKTPMLYTAIVNKSSIIAVKLDRDEGEIITLAPKFTHARRLSRVKASQL